MRSMHEAHDFQEAREHEFCEFCGHLPEHWAHIDTEGDAPHVTSIACIGVDMDESEPYRRRFAVSCSCGWAPIDSVSRHTASTMAEHHRWAPVVVSMPQTAVES